MTSHGDHDRDEYARFLNGATPASGLPDWPHRLAARVPIRAASATARRLVTTIYISTALVGLLASPLRASLADASIAAVLGFSLCLTVMRSFTERWPDPATMRAWTLVAIGVPLFIHGADALDDLGLLITLTLALLVPLRLVESHTDHTDQALAADYEALFEPTGWTTGSAGRRDLRRLLSGIALDDLFDEWRRIEDTVPDGNQRREHEQARADLVAELSRRDPEGARMWVATGLTDRPERHIRSRDGGDQS